MPRTSILSLLLMWQPAIAQMNVSVEGRGLDIRPLKVGTPLYPTGIAAKFSAFRNSPHQVAVMSEPLKSKNYATIPVIPDDKRKDYALTRVKGDLAGDLLIGIANPRFEHATWKRTPGVFKTRTKTYCRYRYSYPTPNEWISLPKTSPETGALPVIVCGESWRPPSVPAAKKKLAPGWSSLPGTRPSVKTVKFAPFVSRRPSTSWIRAFAAASLMAGVAIPSNLMPAAERAVVTAGFATRFPKGGRERQSLWSWPQQGVSRT